MNIFLRRAPARIRPNTLTNVRGLGLRFEHTTAPQGSSGSAPSGTSHTSNTTQSPPSPSALSSQPSPQPPTDPYQAEILRRAAHQRTLTNLSKSQNQVLLELQPKTAKEAQSDARIGLTAIVLLVATPFVCWGYYEVRKRQMYEKKMQMLGEARERYRKATGERLE